MREKEKSLKMSASKLTRSPNLTSSMAMAMSIGEGKRLISEIILIEDEEKLTTTTKEDNDDILHDLKVLIDSIGLISDYRITQKKESQNLARRIKLLTLLLDEIMDMNASLSHSNILSLSSLKRPLLSTRKLLRTCAEGSKIYLALEFEGIMGIFHSVNARLSNALDDIPYYDLGVSDEVKEQVELMSLQLKKARRRTDTLDMELAMDMMIVFDKEDDRNGDIAMIKRLAKKLELHHAHDLEAETNAIRRLAKDKRSEQHIQLILNVLNKFKQIIGIEETDLLKDPIFKKPSEPFKYLSTEIPQEFLCPITLELFTEPVVVATGQTYEKISIQKWLDSGHRTCPKSGQTLSHLSIAPNYALKNVITQWCENNNIHHPPKKPQKPFQKHPDQHPPSSPELKQRLISLISNLSGSHPDTTRESVHAIRILSKENPENRVLIAETQAIPPLISLLSHHDMKIKEHAVTCLLNLSIDDTNKNLIAEQDAIPAIVELLKRGNNNNAGTRENAAAAIFSLSMLDQNKTAVGLCNGIQPLVDLLTNGTVRGKRDAATALFSLSLNHTNKALAIEAGVVRPLVSLLDDTELGMIDEALSILLLLASHPHGRHQIGELGMIEMLVEIMGDCDRTPKNKEGAAAILYELGFNGGSSYLLAALQFGVYQSLVEIGENGTNRGQRKACSILQLMRQYEQIP